MLFFLLDTLVDVLQSSSFTDFSLNMVASAVGQLYLIVKTELSEVPC